MENESIDDKYIIIKKIEKGGTSKILRKKRKRFRRKVYS